jgi:RNA polymerase sigma factor (sigma-70 family)
MSQRERNGACPDSGDVFAAAVELATTGAGPFRRTARRYSICAADADDAYQRSLEILLTKAPTADRAELRPWLHTVIKHEALALRRQRERSVAPVDAGADDTTPLPERGPEETAGERERVRYTAEALGTLKPNELQCLVLKALGYSYAEISARTGFSWTKVNRSLTEGRRRFFECFGEISSGDRCDRFRPLLSAVCDGHAGEEEERTVRAHLSACQGCRATLRAYRSAPSRLAELVPPAAVLPLLERTSLWSRVSDWLSLGGGERAGALGAKLQQSAEMISAQKATAVVASTAAIAGGGVAVQEQVRGLPEREPAARAERPVEPADRPDPVPVVQAPADPAAGALASAPETSQDQSPAEKAAETTATEFGPERSAPDTTTAAASADRGAGEAFGAAAAGTPAPRASGGGGEFGP